MIAADSAIGYFVDRLPKRDPTLADLIDAATLAHERLRTCCCREDCPHDDAAFDADDAVKAYLREKLGLTVEQIGELGGLV